MGLWAMAKSAGRALCNGAKTVVKGAVNVAKKGGELVVEGVKTVGREIKKGLDVWGGKKIDEKARAILAEVRERFRKREEQYKADIEKYTALIKAHVDAINNYKRIIKGELLPQMVSKLRKIGDVSLNPAFATEEFLPKEIKLDGVRSSSELFKIDFNNLSFKDVALSVLTFGIYSRKKAKENLFAAQEEEAKVNDQIAIMDIETKRIELIEASLKQVCEYFETLTELFSNLLIRLDNSVNFLYVRCMNFAHKIVKQEMSIRHLPLMQRKEIEAISTAGLILKTMAEKQLIKVDSKDEVKAFTNDIKSQQEKFTRVYNAA